MRRDEEVVEGLIEQRVLMGLGRSEAGLPVARRQLGSGQDDLTGTGRVGVVG